MKNSKREWLVECNWKDNIASMDTTHILELELMTGFLQVSTHEI